MKIKDSILTGESKQNIIAKTIYTISSDAIKSKTKDIYTLYLITLMYNIEIRDIIISCNKLGICLSDFKYFLINKEDIRYAYLKMRGKHNKYDFDIMYNRIRDFCTPFITKRADKNLNAIWQPEGCVWFPYFN